MTGSEARVSRCFPVSLSEIRAYRLRWSRVPAHHRMQPDSQPPATFALNGGSRRQFLKSTASLLCASGLAVGQDQATFSANVKVVNVLATVRTKKNEIVRNLTKDDFVLLENG